MPGVGSRGIVATGRKALHCLLALCGLMAARSPCAAVTSAAPPAATAAAALYSIREGDLFGLIDAKGRVVLPPEFSESKQRTHRVFDATGRDITPPKIDLVGIPADGMVRVWAERKQGFMTLAGELSVTPRFAQAADFWPSGALKHGEHVGAHGRAEQRCDGRPLAAGWRPAD